MAGNSTKRIVKLTTIMSRAGFVRGFAEVRKGKPLDADAFNNDSRQRWSYERGRQLAIIYKGELKNGRKVLPEAVDAYADAIACKALI